MQGTQFQIFDKPVLLDDSGFFHVKLDTGENLKSMSIVGLNAKAKKAKGFDSFKALKYDRYADPGKPAFTEINVVGIAKDRRGFTLSYRLDNNRFAESVILDTAENRKILRRIRALRGNEVRAEEAIKVLERTLVTRNPRHNIHPVS